MFCAVLTESKGFQSGLTWEGKKYSSIKGPRITWFELDKDNRMLVHKSWEKKTAFHNKHMKDFINIPLSLLISIGLGYLLSMLY